MSTVSRGTGSRRHLPGEPPGRRGDGSGRTFMGVARPAPVEPAALPPEDVDPDDAGPGSAPGGPGVRVGGSPEPVEPEPVEPVAEPGHEPVALEPVEVEPDPDPDPEADPEADPEQDPGADLEPDPGREPPPTLLSVGPGPAVVLAAAGPALAAVALHDGGGVPLVGAGPASLVGVLAVLVPLLVGLAGVVLTRLRGASRLFLVTAGVAGVAAVRGLADPDGSADAGRLLGVPTPWSGLLAWVAVAAVLTLTVALLGRQLSGRPGPGLALAWLVGSAGVLLPWPARSALPFVAAGGLVLGLLAGLAASGTWGRPDGAAPTRALRRRGDLVPAAAVSTLALLLAVAATRPGFAARVGIAAAVLAVAGLLLAGERLARWRAASPLEVLVRCLGGTLVVVVVAGVVRASVVTGDDDGVAGWRVGLAVAALLLTVVAAVLPRPPAPAYTRATHLRVLRSVPWVVLALVVVADAGLVARAAAPGPAGSPSEVAVTAVPTGTATPTASPTSAGPAPSTATGAAPSPTTPSGSSATTVPAGDGLRPLVVRSSPSAAPGTGPWMSVASVSGTQVSIVIGSPVTTGPLEVRTLVGNGAEVSYPLVAVPAGSPQQVTVLLPQAGDFTVELHDLRQTDPLQTLVISR